LRPALLLVILDVPIRLKNMADLETVCQSGGVSWQQSPLPPTLELQVCPMDTNDFLTGRVAIVAVVGAAFTVSAAVPDGSGSVASTASPRTFIAASHSVEMIAIAMPVGKRSSYASEPELQ